MVAKTPKNPYRLQTVTFKLSQKGKKTKIRKEKPKVTYSVALVMAFLLAENENQKVEDLPQADFGRVPERFLLKDFFSCTNRHLTRSLRSLVSYRVKHSKRNSISTRARFALTKS